MTKAENVGMGIMLSVAGILLVVGSGGNITGAYLGANLQPLSGFASGIALLLASLVLLVQGKKKLEEKVSEKPVVLLDTSALKEKDMDVSRYDARLLKKVRDEAIRPGGHRRQPLVPRKRINYLLSEKGGARLEDNPEVTEGDEAAIKGGWSYMVSEREGKIHYDDIRRILEKDRSGHIKRADAYIVAEAIKRGNEPTMVVTHDTNLRRLLRTLRRMNKANVKVYASSEELNEQYKP